MTSQPHLKVRWPDGCFLPIVISVEATGKDISKMLRFACGPKQEIMLTFNDMVVEDDATLKSYGIQNGDTVNALVLTIPKDNLRMIKSFDAIAREAAKISDNRLDQIGIVSKENEDENYVNCSEKSFQKISNTFCHLKIPNNMKNSKKIIRQKLFFNTVIPDKPTFISHCPLPVFWTQRNSNKNQNDEEKGGKKDFRKYSTLEEAGAFYASIGMNQWTW